MINIIYLLSLSIFMCSTVFSSYYHIGCFENIHDLSNAKTINAGNCYTNCKSMRSEYFGLQGGSGTHQTCYCLHESPLKPSNPSNKCKRKTNNGHGTKSAIDLYKIEDRWIIFGHEFTSSQSESTSNTNHNYIVKIEGFSNQNVHAPVPYIGLDKNGTLTHKNQANPIWDQTVYFNSYPQTDYVEFYLTIWNGHQLEGDAYFNIDSNTNCGWTKVKSKVMKRNNNKSDYDDDGNDSGYIYYSVFNPKSDGCYGDIYSNDPSPL